MTDLQTTLSNRWQLLFASGLLLLGATLFSTKGIIVKLLYREDIDALSMLALRMMFATPMYLSIYFFSRKKENERNALTKRDWWMVALVGVLGYHLASWFDLMGLQYISASIERLIFFCFPTIVVLILFFFYREPITKKILVALVLTYIGIAIAFMDKTGMASHTNFQLGLVLIIMTALTYSIYVVISGRLLPRIGTLRYTCIGMAGAGVAVLVHHGLAGANSLFQYSFKVYAYVLGMALFSTVIPSFMLSEGIRILGASRSSILLSIGPIATLIMAKYILGEDFGALQLIGTLVVITGITYLSINRNQKKAVLSKSKIQKD